MPTREGRENRENSCAVIKVAAAYRDIAAAIFQSSVKIDGLTREDPPQDFITRVLYENGTICRYKPLGLWLTYSGNGKQNVYGEYLTYTLTGADGRTITASRSEIEIYNANPQKNPLSTFVRIKANTIASAEGAKRQNLDGVKKCTVIYTDSKDTANKLRIADNKRRNGAAVVIMERGTKEYESIETLDTGAEFICDKLQDFQAKEWEQLLHYVGVYTTIDKSAEVKQSEVEAQNAETNAFMNVLVKTFNRCAEYEGAPYRMRVDRENDTQSGGNDEDGEKPDEAEETPQNDEGGA